MCSWSGIFRVSRYAGGHRALGREPYLEVAQIGAVVDRALLGYTHKFEKATSLTSPVLKAPFPGEFDATYHEQTIEAIDISFENIRKFHCCAEEKNDLWRSKQCLVLSASRFSRPIERVGLYVPGGTAVLPSTAMMLGVPAMVAGCQKIVLASPPRADGSLTPEIVYVAHKVGAESIVLAGGAQAVAAMAYGTESVSKVDKILGPGNQFVTAAKMHREQRQRPPMSASTCPLDLPKSWSSQTRLPTLHSLPMTSSQPG